MTPLRTILDWLSPLDRMGIAALALGGGLLGGLLQGPAQGVLIGLMAGLCAAIARIDSIRFTIPDLLVLPLALLGLAHVALRGGDLAGHLLASAALALLLLALRAVLSRRRGRTVLGLGDVKLAAAAAFWLPPDLLPAYIFLAAASGLVEIAPRGTPDGPVPFGRHLAPWLFFCVLAEDWLLPLLTPA